MKNKFFYWKIIKKWLKLNWKCEKLMCSSDDNVYQAKENNNRKFSRVDNVDSIGKVYFPQIWVLTQLTNLLKYHLVFCG